MILFLSIEDSANAGYMFARCLESIGVKATALAMQPIPVPEITTFTPVVSSVPELRGAVDAAHVIVLMHSHPALLSLQVSFDGKRLFAFHGGSIYRSDPEGINGLFNPIIERALIQTGELLDCGAKDEEWLLPAVDTDTIEPKYSLMEGPLVVGHFPRDQYGAGLKGTPEINEVMAGILGDFDYRHEIRMVPWEQSLKRMVACDIYIESLSQGSAHYNKHDWSITALEAATLGCVVVTNFTHLKRYEQEYGGCLLQVANSKAELHEVMIRLLAMGKRELHRLQRRTHDWVCKYHSYCAIGQRLKRVLNV